VSAAAGWFAPRLIAWQREAGRHDLPWQGTRDAYRIWLSEIMLQQTRVATVIPYYQRFLARFPDVRALAGADSDEVLALWSGLGYYSRARLLHRCAQRIVAAHGGVFPREPGALEQLPGIGPSTAAAIAVFAHGQRAAILDGNVKRVLCRFLGVIEDPARRSVMLRLLESANELLPEQDLERYTQGLMDLGALVCTPRRPTCAACPLAPRCQALATGDPERLPLRAARRALPERRVTLLVLCRGSEVLLEKRPPAGVWGGLWSLPESTLDEADGLAREVRARFGAAPRTLEALAPLRHVFTHFRLLAFPWRVRLAGTGGGALVAAEEPARRWFRRCDLEAAGLPAPVRRLLGELSRRADDAPQPGA